MGDPIKLVIRIKKIDTTTAKYYDFFFCTKTLILNLESTGEA